MDKVYVIVAEEDTNPRNKRKPISKCFKTKEKAKLYFNELTNRHNFVYIELFESEMED